MTELQSQRRRPLSGTRLHCREQCDGLGEVVTPHFSSPGGQQNRSPQGGRLPGLSPGPVLFPRSNWRKGWEEPVCSGNLGLTWVSWGLSVVPEIGQDQGLSLWRTPSLLVCLPPPTQVSSQQGSLSAREEEVALRAVPEAQSSPTSLLLRPSLQHLWNECVLWNVCPLASPGNRCGILTRRCAQKPQ